MNKQKKGFTLIELMVVIVIIGILAAIAIPKLFGMTAKAKAQEVGPAAGTWVKLQQAYQAEMSAFGGNAKISYIPPGASAATKATTATYFTYDTSPASDATSVLTAVTWTATVKGTMGDCKGGAVYTVEINTSNTVSASIASDTGGECANLTPRFKELK